MDPMVAARRVIARCRQLATYTEEPGHITRTFLSPPMRHVHARLTEWLADSAYVASIDGVGNLRARKSERPKLCVGSHVDTVPHAGAFDGILGVAMAVELAACSESLEVVAFSEEEGVRFGVPFIGSRGFLGEPPADDVRDVARAYGLADAPLPASDAPAYLEFHIEQGPVLESLGLPLGIVETIVGQSRMDIVFHGGANHAGTTPMHLRRDALAGAAVWISHVESAAQAVAGLVATVGHIDVAPNAGNVIAARARVSLDIRHADDAVRAQHTARLLADAREIAASRGLSVDVIPKLDQAAVSMDVAMTDRLAAAAAAAGHSAHRMNSGAGHDAMIVAARMPAAMLFVRSPGGVSHHPDENVLEADVAAAFEVGLRFVQQMEEQCIT